VIRKIYFSRFIQKLLKTDRANISKIVNDDWSVLDIGCGPNPPLLEYVRPASYVGVDAYQGSINRLLVNQNFDSLKDKKAICTTIETLDFESNQFDAVLLVDLIEHLPKQMGVEVLKNSKRWSSKAVYVSTPNGFLQQKPYDSNSYQEHLSGWTKEDFEDLGFQWIRGGGGPKFLRLGEMSPEQWNHADAGSIRFKPKKFWSIVANLLQCFSFWLPTYSYQLYAVYWKDE
jgi:SAM-dependent methyltransferase